MAARRSPSTGTDLYAGFQDPTFEYGDYWDSVDPGAGEDFGVAEPPPISQDQAPEVIDYPPAGGQQMGDPNKLQAWRDAWGPGMVDETDARVYGDPEFQNWNPGDQLPSIGAGWEGDGGSGGGGSNDAFLDSVKSALQGLFAGDQNQDIVQRRVGSARDDLNRALSSRTKSNRAALANRGLLGSGPEQTAQNLAESDLYGQFRQSVNDIYANESENADRRMLESLGIGAGLGAEDERIGLDRTLGLGNLALGNQRLAAENNLALGRFGLDRDRLLLDAANGDINALTQLLEQLMSGAQTSSGGYI